MKNNSLSLSIVLGLLGLALATRTDIPYALWIGLSFIVVSGALFFVFLRIKEENDRRERDALLAKIAQIPDAIQTAGKRETEQLARLLEFVSDAFRKTIPELSNAQLARLTNMSNSLAAVNEDVNSSTRSIIEQINNYCNSTIQLIDELAKASAAVQSAAQMQLELNDRQLEQHTRQVEQNNRMYEMIIDDVRNTLAVVAESQHRFAEDVSDNVKKSMKSTENAIRELLLSLDHFSSRNTEAINNSIAGYKQFETLIHKTLEQMTSISDQDYELLKGLIK